MNSFSLYAYNDCQSVIDHYKQWLTYDLYKSTPVSLDDPTFLKKLSIMQAESIRFEIEKNTVTSNASILNASASISNKVQSAAQLITSSLDDGFSLMNTRMMEVNCNLHNIGQGISVVNQTLLQGNQILSNIDGGISQMNRGIGAVASGIGVLNQNMMAGMDTINQNMMAGIAALSSNIAQAASAIAYQLQQSEAVLQQLLDELRIPESQRERRYHIEEGMKYFNKGMISGDCLYFEDALDEFTQATTIERKDFFSWYYIGMIHLYSKEHIDPEKALSAFDRYIHYADALPQKHDLFDEAWMMKAECKYLMQDMDAAFGFVEKIMTGSDKAALRGMKYLSSSEDSYKQQKAVEILKQLMLKNPYIVMQVLEDYDLVSNSYIINYIKEYKKGIIDNLPNVFDSVDSDVQSVEKYVKFYNDIRLKFNSYKDKFYYGKDTLGVVDLLRINDDVNAIRKEISKFLEFANMFHCGLAKIQEDGKWGFMDEEGSIVVPCQFVSVHDFHEDLAVVRLNGYDGVINKKGEFVINCERYDFIHDFSDGIAQVQEFDLVKSSSFYGLIDKTGRLICPCKWKDIWTWRLNEGYAKVRDISEKWGVIDRNGHLIIPCIWEEINDYNYKNGYVKVKNKDEKWGAVDMNGRMIVSCKYKDYGDFFCYKNYNGVFECHEHKK